jgi:CRISPR-associated Cas5-like protein
MKVIRFTTEGLINSFRIPQTSAHQLTYLAPTKTNIVGMITSIMGKGEDYYYNLLKNIKVGVVPLQIDSLFTDAWTFRKWKESGSGRDILKREKLYKTRYVIYIACEEDLRAKIYDSIKNPLRIPSLGMDDEMVLIRDLTEIEMEKTEDNKIHSIFKFEEGMQFIPKFGGFKGMQIFPPRITTINLDFNVKKIPRKPEKFIQIVEFAGLYCELSSPQEFYFDHEKNYNVEIL